MSSKRSRMGEDEEDTVIISVTYGEETTDILTSIREVFEHSKELGEEIPKVLQEILEGQLENIPGIQRVSPTKRQKTSTDDHLQNIQFRLEAWKPDAQQVKRVHGKAMYMSLLQALQQHSTVKQVQPILHRLHQYWQSQPTDFGDKFLPELGTLCKECSAVPELHSTVSTLLHDFKRKCA